MNAACRNFTEIRVARRDNATTVFQTSRATRDIAFNLREFATDTPPQVISAAAMSATVYYLAFSNYFLNAANGPLYRAQWHSGLLARTKRTYTHTRVDMLSTIR
jgi:hypothetical protein